MVKDTLIEDQLDEFNKIVDDLLNVNVTLEDEDQAILLVNDIPKSLEHFKDTMLFGRQESLLIKYQLYSRPKINNKESKNI